jgi:hypothetical protein
LRVLREALLEEQRLAQSLEIRAKVQPSERRLAR